MKACRIVGWVVTSALALVAMIVAGCKSVPSVDEMYARSYAVGYAAGTVANRLDVSARTRRAVSEVLNVVTECVPGTNQTFEAAWTPVAQSHVDRMVAEGRLSREEGMVALAAFGMAARGLDFLFEVRFRKARECMDLVVAAVDGSTAGFLTVFRSADDRASALESFRLDEDAYRWLLDISRENGVVR